MEPQVSLVGLTQPSASTGCHSANELIAYAARVSNPENQANGKTAPKLLAYLIKHEHWSPGGAFNMECQPLFSSGTGRVYQQ